MRNRKARSTAKEEEFTPPSFELISNIAHLEELNITLNIELVMISSKIFINFILPLLLSPVLSRIEPLKNYLRQIGINNFENYQFENNLPHEYPELHINTQDFHKQYFSLERLNAISKLHVDLKYNPDLIKKIENVTKVFESIRFHAINSANSSLDSKLALVNRAITVVIQAIFQLMPLVSLGYNIYKSQFKYSHHSKLLSNNDAETYFIQLDLQTKRKANYTYLYKVATISLAMISFIVLAYNYESLEKLMDQPIFYFVYANITSLGNEAFAYLCNIFSDNYLLKQINHAENNLNTALKVTGGKLRLIETRKLAENYFVFTATKSYQTVSPTIINQVTKDILLKHGIDILNYGHTSHSFIVPSINNKKAIAIRSQIKSYLDNLVLIKKLFMQLKVLFEHIEIVKMVNIVNELPLASFLIPVTLSEEKLQKFVSIFSHCEISQLDNYISITGNTPAINTPLSLSTIPESKSCFETAELKPTIIKVHKPKNQKEQTQNVETSRLNPVEEEKPVHYRWPSGEYPSNSEDNSIKPLNHPILGKNHFILFAIPKKTCFPTDAMYEKIRSKVEEGRLATSSQAQQGLQFRSTAARDETDPHRRWFSSDLRYKALGLMGDIRIYAEAEINEEGKHLHVFKGVNLNAH